MSHHSPEPAPATGTELDRLRHAGWSVGAVVGHYCVAWRGAEEVVLHLDASGQWKVISNRSAGRLAA